MAPCMPKGEGVRNTATVFTILNPDFQAIARQQEKQKKEQEQWKEPKAEPQEPEQKRSKDELDKLMNNANSGGQNNASQPQTSSLFGNTATSQPQQGGGLFGASTAQANPAGGLFGNTTNSQPAQSGGLFGGAATSQPQQSGGLFGSSTTTGQQQQSGGLFGSSTATSQPQQSSGLFGNLGGNAGNQQAGGGGLFGSTTQQSQQPQQSGSLFGGTLGQNQNKTGGLFGGMGQNQSQPQQQSGGLFGNLGQNQTQSQPAQGGGLFGNLGAQNKPTGSLFGGSTAQQPQQQQQQQQQGGGLFGGNTSLFGGSVTGPPVGSLSMGQNTTQPSQAGAKIDLTHLRPTTRFNDLTDDLKKEIEEIDAFIKKQESFAAQCEAMMPAHLANLESLAPDVELISGKIETVELALENDSRVISQAKDLEGGDRKDVQRIIRVVENLRLPTQFHYAQQQQGYGRGGAGAQPDDDSYDVDLVGYFSRQADAMQSTLATFTSHLGEIEQHLRVIEASTLQQGQLVMSQRGAGGEDTVRELADTLRGFENGILGAASLVGGCREGVNELVMGRVSGSERGGGGYGRRY